MTTSPNPSFSPSKQSQIKKNPPSQDSTTKTDSSFPKIDPNKKNPNKNELLKEIKNEIKKDSTTKPTTIKPEELTPPNPPIIEIGDRERFKEILALSDPKEKLKQYQELYCRIQSKDNPQLKSLMEKDKMILGSKEIDLKDFNKALFYNKLEVDPNDSEIMKNICLEKYPQSFRFHSSRKEKGKVKLNLLIVITNIRVGLEFIDSMVWLEEDKIKNDISEFVDDKISQLKNIIKTTDIFQGHKGPSENKKLLNHKEICDTITDIKKIISIVGNNAPNKQDFIDILEKLMISLEKIRIYQRGIHNFEAYGFGQRDTSISRDYEKELMEMLGLKFTTKKSKIEKVIDGQLEMFFRPNNKYDIMKQSFFMMVLPNYLEHKEYIKQQLKHDEKANDNTKKLAEEIK